MKSKPKKQPKKSGQILPAITEGNKMDSLPVKKRMKANPKSSKALVKIASITAEKAKQVLEVIPEIFMDALDSSIESINSRQRGTEANKEASEKKYQIAREIFILISKDVPVKKDAIEVVIHPIWRKRTMIKPPKKDTLFAYQARYMAELKRKP